MPHVQSIVYKPADALLDDSGYTRLCIDETDLIAGHGIRGDLKGGGKRQINIMSAESLAALAGEGFMTEAGRMGEQLVVAGFDVNTLKPGECIRIGSTAVLEMMEPRTGCAKFERYQNKIRSDAAGRLGMIAVVVVGGRIRVGDEVAISAPVQAPLFGR